MAVLAAGHTACYSPGVPARQKKQPPTAGHWRGTPAAGHRRGTPAGWP